MARGLRIDVGSRRGGRQVGWREAPGQGRPRGVPGGGGVRRDVTVVVTRHPVRGHGDVVRARVRDGIGHNVEPVASKAFAPVITCCVFFRMEDSIVPPCQRII